MDDASFVFFKANPDPMLVYDLETLKILAVNGAAIHRYGYTHDEFCAMTIKDITPQDDVTRLLANVSQVTDGLDEAGVWRHRLKDGTIIHVEIRSHTVNYNGVRGEMVAARDVSHLIRRETELKAAQKRAEEKADFLRMAGGLAHLGAWVVVPGDEDHVYWSDETAAIHDMPPGTSPSVSEAFEFYAPEYRSRIGAAFTACMRHGTPFDEVLEIITATGRRVWVRTMGMAEKGEDGSTIRVRGAFQDISELVAAQQETRRLEQKLHETLNTIGDAFFTLDRDWKFTFVNRVAAQQVNRIDQDLTGRSIWEEFPHIAGSMAEERYRHAVSTGESVSFSTYIKSMKKWFDIKAYPSPDGLAVYFQDVTERRSLEEQLRQSQRLDAIGQLTGGVAHDFNNLLTVILGNAELLSEALVDDRRLGSMAALTRSAAERAAQLTSRLLAFSRRQPLDPKPVDVCQLIIGMDDLLRRTLGEHIDIRLGCSTGMIHAQVDPAQLENALLNLCINARDAMPGGGRLTIETTNVRLDAAVSSDGDPISAGNYVSIAISDTGHGMTAETLARAVEPFFTTKPVGQGSGMGLSMVYGFVKQSAGHLALYSEPGEGTTVRICLPTTDAPVAGASRPDEAPAPRGSETILLVEDEDLVRDHVATLMRGLGYTVSTARNGPDALGLLKRGQTFDLLFTDVIMPGGMTGRELAEAAHGIFPGMPVMFTSGYGENAIVHHGRLDPGVDLLAKPYRRIDLARKLRSALDARLSGSASSRHAP